jgi:capsular polysaccharide biosynthesis protein
VNPAYLATIRLAVSVPPEEGSGEYYTFNGLYAWQFAEYLTDDMGEIMRSAAFAADVERHLGRRLDYSIVQSGRPQKTHRILSFTIRVPDAENGTLVGNAIVQAIQQDSKKYLAELNATNAQLAVLDPPFVRPEIDQTRWLFELAARLVLAGVAGAGLALFLHLMDNKLYASSEVEQALAVPVLGLIPREPRSEKPAEMAGLGRATEVLSRRRGEA